MGFMRCGGCVRSNEPSWVRSWSSYLRATHTERAVSHARKMACGRASRQPRRPRTYTQERQGCTRLRHGEPCGISARFPGQHQRCTGLGQPCLSMRQNPHIGAAERRVPSLNSGRSTSTSVKDSKSSLASTSLATARSSPVLVLAFLIEPLKATTCNKLSHSEPLPSQLPSQLAPARHRTFRPVDLLSDAMVGGVSMS